MSLQWIRPISRLSSFSAAIPYPTLTSDISSPPALCCVRYPPVTKVTGHCCRLHRVCVRDSGTAMATMTRQFQLLLYRNLGITWDHFAFFLKSMLSSIDRSPHTLQLHHALVVGKMLVNGHDCYRRTGEPYKNNRRTTVGRNHSAIHPRHPECSGRPQAPKHVRAACTRESHAPSQQLIMLRVVRMSCMGQVGCVSTYGWDLDNHCLLLSAREQGSPWCSGPRMWLRTQWNAKMRKNGGTEKERCPW